VAFKDQGSYTWYEAITICEELVLNGYDDWYLPNREELATLFQYRNLIGGFSENYSYWSSSKNLINLIKKVK